MAFQIDDQGFEEAVNLNCGGIGQISDYWGNDYFDDVIITMGNRSNIKGIALTYFLTKPSGLSKNAK